MYITANKTEKDSGSSLRKFFHHAIRPDVAREVSGLLPENLAWFQSSGGISGEYPACLVESENDLSILPLPELINKAVNLVDLHGDEIEQCRLVARRLVDQIRAAAEEKAEERLSGLWGMAATAMIADPNLPEWDREVIRKDLNRLWKTIDFDGQVIPFHSGTPVQLMLRTAEWHREVTGQRLANEIEAISSSLKEILDRDGRENCLPEERKERLVSTLTTLQSWQTILGELRETNSEISVQSAVAYVQHKAKAILSLFRAIRVGRLETANAYNDEIDEMLAHFVPADLTASERALFPPIVVHLDTGAMRAADIEDVFGLLDAELPVKILVTIDRLFDQVDVSAGRTTNWRIYLAQRAASMGNAFVFQAAASQARYLMKGFKDGLQYRGPAIYCIYAGAGTSMPGVSSNAAVASVLASRLFPAFAYDPSKGDDQASRFEMSENPQPDRMWPEVEITGPDGQETKKVTCTPVDLLAVDEAFRGQFTVIPDGIKPDMLDPVDRYLEESEQGEKFPFVVLVGEKGREFKVGCTRYVIRIAQSVAAQWRMLQEMGGINNSHALRAVAAEKQRLLKEFEKEKEVLVKQHEEEKELLTEVLAQKITSNIAAGLLGLAESGISPDVVQQTALEFKAAAAETSEKAEEVKVQAPVPKKEPVKIEDEDLSFDEAYVDSSLCTSCDECINTNDKIFDYNEDDRAYVKDPRGGPYADLVKAAENCPARAIHPGKPLDPNEPGLDELVKRAEPYM